MKEESHDSDNVFFNKDEVLVDIALHKNMKFSIKDFFSKCDQIHIVVVINIIKINQKLQHIAIFRNVIKARII